MPRRKERTREAYQHGLKGWSLRPRGYPVTRFPFTVLPVTTGLSRGPRAAQCPAQTIEMGKANKSAAVGSRVFRRFNGSNNYSWIAPLVSQWPH